MRALRASAFLVLIAFCGCAAFGAETLKVERKSFPASSLRRARLESGAGILAVRGRPGTGEIEVTAEFKAGIGAGRDILDRLRLTMEVRGDTFLLRSEMLDNGFRSENGWIDLNLTLPPALALEIQDGSGDLEVSGMDADVSIRDGSGSIKVDHLGGNLVVHDGSGDIDIREVARNVEIHDGSGSIEVLHIGGNLWVGDGSGSLSARDIGGRFEVGSKGSGSIRYEDVRGEVRVPNRKHRTD